MLVVGVSLVWRYDALQYWCALLKFCPPGSKPDGWGNWRTSIKTLPKQGLAFLDELSAWIRKSAENLEKLAASERYQSFWQWAQEQAKTRGAAAIFKWIRGRRAWAEFEVDLEQGELLARHSSRRCQFRGCDMASGLASWRQLGPSGMA